MPSKVASSKLIKARVIRGSKLHRRTGSRMEVELVGQVIKGSGKCRKAKGSVIKGRKLELLKGKCLNISQKCLNLSLLHCGALQGVLARPVANPQEGYLEVGEVHHPHHLLLVEGQQSVAHEGEIPTLVIRVKMGKVTLKLSQPARRLVRVMVMVRVRGS